jgi:hypothetical protein
MFAVLLNQRDQKQSVLVTASSARDVEHALERMIIAQRARWTITLYHVGGPSSAAMRKFISTRRCPTVMHWAWSNRNASAALSPARAKVRYRLPIVLKQHLWIARIDTGLLQ